MTGYEDLRVEAHRIAPWLIPVISTSTGTGTTAYLVDARWIDPQRVTYGPQALNTMWMLRPDAVSDGDREREIGGNAGSGLDPATGRIYPKAAWANLPAGGEQYELSALQPSVMHGLLNATLENFLQATYHPLYAFADSDMEDAGTASYAVSGLGSLAKTALQDEVHSGRQALHFAAAGAGEYVETPAMIVVPGKTYHFSAIFKVAGGRASLGVFDLDHGTEISRRYGHGLPRFMSVGEAIMIPKGCTQVAYRVYAEGGVEDVYIDCFTRPVKADDTLLGLPAYLRRSSDLRKVLTARYLGGFSPGVYDADSRYYEEIPRQFYNPRFALHHANPARVELHGYSLPMAETWVESVRKASDITVFEFTAAGETSPTTELPKRHIALEWVRRCCLYVLSYQADDADANATLGSVTEELAPLNFDYAGDLETEIYETPHPLRGRSWSGV